MQSELTEIMLRREIASYGFIIDEYSQMLEAMHKLAGVYSVTDVHGHLHIIFQLSPDQIGRCRREPAFMIKLVEQKGKLVDDVIEAVGRTMSNVRFHIGDRVAIFTDGVLREWHVFSTRQEEDGKQSVCASLVSNNKIWQWFDEDSIEKVVKE